MKALRIFGKLLISVGVGVLLFVGWTLWGTGLYTQQQQDALQQEFDQLPSVDVAEDDPATLGPDGPVGPGRAAFKLDIPAIDLEQIVVEGVGTEELKKGPGHYPSCRSGFDRPLCTEFDEVWPGQDGRVIVSGHRTTYGAPFFDLDKLKKGDEIVTLTKWGEFTYEVTETRIVQPDSLAIAIQSDEPEIVLTTCHPKYSAAQRLIVFGRLVS